MNNINIKFEDFHSNNVFETPYFNQVIKFNFKTMSPGTIFPNWPNSLKGQRCDHISFS